MRRSYALIRGLYRLINLRACCNKRKTLNVTCSTEMKGKEESTSDKIDNDMSKKHRGQFAQIY